MISGFHPTNSSLKRSVEKVSLSIACQPLDIHTRKSHFIFVHVAGTTFGLKLQFVRKMTRAHAHARATNDCIKARSYSALCGKPESRPQHYAFNSLSTNQHFVPSCREPSPLSTGYELNQKRTCRCRSKRKILSQQHGIHPPPLLLSQVYELAWSTSTLLTAVDLHHIDSGPIFLIIHSLTTEQTNRQTDTTQLFWGLLYFEETATSSG